MYVQDMTEQQATDAVHKAFSLGVNLWDTSPYYGATKSEQARPHADVHHGGMYLFLNSQVCMGPVNL